MMLAELTLSLEADYPLSWQMRYDNAGLNIGNPAQKIEKVFISLDCSQDLCQEVIEGGYDVWITHHPLLFHPLKTIQPSNTVVWQLIKHEIAHYSLHTNFDQAPYGTSELMLSALGVEKTTKLQAQASGLKKLVVFVPKSHQQSLFQALAEAGFGQIGDYSHCSFQLEGQGTFLPHAEARPFIGKNLTLNYVAEVRLEMIFPDFLLPAVPKLLQQHHPYEEPAYDIYPLDNANPYVGMGAGGDLATAYPLEPFLDLVAHSFQVPVLKCSRQAPDNIQKVACVGGAGADLVTLAEQQGFDALITGEIKHHQFVETKRMLLIDLGHFESEVLFNRFLKQKLQSRFPKLQIETATRSPIFYHQPS